MGSRKVWMNQMVIGARNHGDGEEPELISLGRQTSASYFQRPNGSVRSTSGNIFEVASGN